MIPDTVTRQDAELLERAFSSFSRISGSLERAYVELELEVKHLSGRLEASNRYLGSILESLPCGILVLQGRSVTTVNERACKLLGARRPSQPTPMEELLQHCIHGERLLAILSSDAPSGEIVMGSPDETILHYSWAQMGSGERVLVLQDVTQMRSLENQMRRSEQLAAMGEMAVELAHEIRNPLSGLELFASLLKEKDLNDAERDSYLRNIQIGIRSLDTVVNNMLCFSRPPQPQKELVRLEELLEEIASLMAVLVKQRGISLDQKYQGRSQVWGDRDMLRQVFNNLALNALQALPEGGRLEFSTAARDGGVEVIIRDNGIGIPEDLQQLIFEPRFTTHPKGHGIGLAVVKRIVEAHEGEVTLRSGPKWGSEFSLVFPRGNE